MVRHGIKQALQDEWDGAMLGEAQTSQEVLEQVRRQAWDAVILDLNLPGRAGVGLIEEVKALQESTAIVVFTMHSEDQFALRALKAGAAAYVTKDKPLSELMSAIRKVLAGGRYVSPALAEELAGALGKGTGSQLHDALSERELQVLLLIGAGKSTSEIAAELSLSVKTISTYRSRLLEKMNMRTTAQLVRYAIENKLLP